MFADDIIVYKENPTDSNKELLNLVGEFGETAGYKVNIRKLKAFLYTPTMKYQEQISGKKNPISYSNKKNKVPGRNLTKEVKDLYSENYTTLKKEIKEDTNKWKHIPCPWVTRV